MFGCTSSLYTIDNPSFGEQLRGRFDQMPPELCLRKHVSRWVNIMGTTTSKGFATRSPSTGLDQKSDNFKVPLMSCSAGAGPWLLAYTAVGRLCLWRHPIPSPHWKPSQPPCPLSFPTALPAHPPSGCKRLRVPGLLHYLSLLGLCWNRTQPEIGQLQSAHSELLWKEALILHLSCIRLCWHLTQPEIGQLQGAHSELLWKEALLQIHLSLFGLCWHRTWPIIGQLQGAPP